MLISGFEASQGCIALKGSGVLARRLNSLEFLLFFYRRRGLSPSTHMEAHSLSVSLVPGDLTASFGLCRHQAHREQHISRQNTQTPQS